MLNGRFVYPSFIKRLGPSRGTRGKTITFEINLGFHLQPMGQVMTDVQAAIIIWLYRLLMHGYVNGI